MNDEKLATELLHQLKRQAIFWFVMSLVELLVIIGIVIGGLWYISLPTEESYTIEQESDNDSYNQVVGGDYNGVETESNLQEEESNKK